jgi:ATP adenylyltransferase
MRPEVKTLWAPWRIKYILGKKPDSCVFCIKKSRGYMKRHHILHESAHALVIMNKYPYAPGHIMVIPKRHIKDVRDLTRKELPDFFELVQIAISALEKAFKPHGFNIGANLGKVAGAGEENHLHFHIVARWNGDANFMPVIGQTRIMSEYLDQTYERLLPYFSNITSAG